MLKRLLRWHEDRQIGRLDLSEPWESAVAAWPVAARYRGSDRVRLRDCALRFLLRNQFVAGGDFELEDPMRLLLATMAAVPVLELGLNWYRGWSSVVVYETPFVPDGAWEDEFGIVHQREEALSGEAWLQGPVILSWQDVLEANAEDAYNVVIHEMAHKLDMLDGDANGAPPLHRGMDPAAWKQSFSRAWAALEADPQAQAEHLPVDPYALEDSGEFFAVTSECFFEAPLRLATAWPEVYNQLCGFYRQDPRKALGEQGSSK